MTVRRGAPGQQVRGVVHDYWIERRKLRDKQQAARTKRQAASSKQQALDKPVDLWDKVI